MSERLFSINDFRNAILSAAEESDVNIVHPDFRRAKGKFWLKDALNLVRVKSELEPTERSKAGSGHQYSGESIRMLSGNIEDLMVKPDNKKGGPHIGQKLRYSNLTPEILSLALSYLFEEDGEVKT